MSETQLKLFDMPTIYDEKIKGASTIEEKVLRMLPQGSEHPVSRQQVADVLGIDVRAVSSIVADLTNKGFAIGNDNGYYLIISEQELERTYTNIRASGFSMMLRAERLKQNYYNQFKDTKKAVNANQ